jgi:hypothetical protein
LLVIISCQRLLSLEVRNVATYKCTLFINGDGYGWTENYYVSLASYNGAQAVMTAYLPYRTAILSQSCQVVYLRISDVTIFRDAQVLVPPPASGSGKYVTGGVENPDTAMKLRITASPTLFSRMFIRGIPDGQITNFAYTPTPDYELLVIQWAGFLQDPFNAFSLQNRRAAPGAPNAFDTGTANTSQGFHFQTGVAPTGLVKGNLLYISGTHVPGTTGLKPFVSSLNNGDGTYQINVGGGRPYFANTFNGFWSSRPTTYTQLVSALFEQPTSRRAGRPFGLSRGRRPTLILRRQ